MSADNAIFAYYQKITDGSEPAGEYIRQIYAYLVKGLEEKAFFFDQKKADNRIKWMEEHCFHVKGPLAPQKQKLELWQKAFLSAAHGIVDKDGKPQFTEILLEVGRKCGKSIIASDECNFELRNGGFGSEIYCVAPKMDQADIVFGTTWTMVTMDPEYKSLCEYLDERDIRGCKIHDDAALPKKRLSTVEIRETNSVLKKIAFSEKTADGFNPSLVICDEIAAWPGQKGLRMYDVMASGMGARDGKAQIISITTAGYENDGIFDELMKRATSFLNGSSKEQRFLPIIYMIDDVDKWNDINELRKSLPQLGKSISIDFMLDQIKVAESSLPKKSEFLVKYCNVKQNSSAAWLNAIDVEKCFSGKPLSFDQFERCYCVTGLDLSQTVDLTSACAVIEKAGKLHVISHFWMPAEKVDEATARDGVPYRQMIQRGWLSESGDNFVDYHDVFKWFDEIVSKYKLYPLVNGYDRYSAQYLIADLESLGYHNDDVFQGENLTPVINEVDGLIRDGAFDFGDNGLLKAHILSSALKMNNETNRKRLVKVSQKEHIDGMAALLDAMTVRQKHYAEIGTRLRNDRR